MLVSSPYIVAHWVFLDFLSKNKHEMGYYKEKANNIYHVFLRRKKNYIILDNSWGTSTYYQHSGLHKYPETYFYLDCTHAVNSSRSQNQTCTTFCSMDDCTDKHLVKGLRTHAQGTTANIHIGGAEKLLLSGVFLLISVAEG